jgi:hypothetical protein
LIFFQILIGTSKRKGITGWFGLVVYFLLAENVPQQMMTKRLAKLDDVAFVEQKPPVAIPRNPYLYLIIKS